MIAYLLSEWNWYITMGLIITFARMINDRRWMINRLRNEPLWISIVVLITVVGLAIMLWPAQLLILLHWLSMKFGMNCVKETK